MSEDEDSPPLVFESWSGFVDAVDTALENKEEKINIIQHLYKQKINEGNVQPQLNEFFEDNFELVLLGIVSDEEHLEEMLIEAERREKLDPNIKASFEDMWSKISWVQDGAISFLVNYQYNSKYWSDGDIDYQYREDGRLIIEHTLYWGVDKIHETTVPSDRFFQEAVNRVEALTNYIEERASEGEEIDEELKGDLKERRNELNNSIEKLDWVINNLKAEENKNVDES